MHDFLFLFSSLDLKVLTSDTIDILQHFLPTEMEHKAFNSYLADGKSLNQLADEDRFLYGVNSIRLREGRGQKNDLDEFSSS